MDFHDYRRLFFESFFSTPLVLAAQPLNLALVLPAHVQLSWPMSMRRSPINAPACPSSETRANQAACSRVDIGAEQPVTPTIRLNATIAKSTSTRVALELCRACRGSRRAQCLAVRSNSCARRACAKP